MKNKFITHEAVMRRFEKKFPGISRDIEAELEKLRIAGKIAAYRKRAHLSQIALAKKIGTTQSVIARMESPDYKDYKVSTLLKIAQVTGGTFLIAA
ncbi:MAG: hypothetical protein A2902_04615 [Elusimicrobia bacterium RIFCSPLOWO2_01_FULL_64_13]|nr:MAG: hypothetical protein A2636_03305 [Elusimicrobia bacterium RIFCSPHIGHO2_01_FULL_64_10]OGR97820.1 MAG: hypothetical protein A2902_04615 [Elusimicrobia bacterium RIFCSPLOWO2_01_FULL_64_13]